MVHLQHCFTWCSIDCFRTVLLEVLLTIINDNMILNNTCRQDNPRECDLQLWNCSSGSFKWQAHSSKPCMLRSKKIQSLHSYKNMLYVLFCFIRHDKHSMLPYIFWIPLGLIWIIWSNPTHVTIAWLWLSGYENLHWTYAGKKLVPL